MRGVAAAVAMVGAVWIASACGAAAFVCSSDAQCQGGAAEGTCQANGYCSFPDESCDSGQRYGEAAPAGVANACVEPEGGTGSTTDPGIEHTSEGPPPDPDGTLDASTTEATEETSTTSPVGDGTSTGPDPTTGMGSESTGTIASCNTMLVDAFDDAALSPMWSVSSPPGTNVIEENEQLWVAIDASPEWLTAVVYMEVDPLAGGWARVLVSEPPEGNQPLAGGISLANETCQLQLYSVGDDVLALQWNNDVQMTIQLGYEASVGLPLWLQLRQDPDGEVRFEWSNDAASWMDIASGSFPECGDLSGPVRVSVGAGGQLEQGPVARAFDQFEACLP